MDNNIEMAIENINTIKHTIENSKTHESNLYRLFLFYGIYNLILFLINIATLFNVIPVNIAALSSLFILASLFIFYIRIYIAEKNSSNKFYLTFLNIWIILSLPLDIIFFGIELIAHTSLINGSEFDYLSFTSVQYYSNMLLFSICLILCAYLLKRKYLILLSIISITIYLLIDTCFKNIGFISPYSNGNVQINFNSAYHILVVTLGYIVLGLYLKYNRRLPHESKQHS